jgi:hypothetical protein
MRDEALRMERHSAEHAHAAADRPLKGLQLLDLVKCLGRQPGSALLSRPAAKSWARQLLMEVRAAGVGTFPIFYL